MAITGIKGFNDILPGEVEKWQYIEATARRVFELYGLSEIRVPILECREPLRRITQYRRRTSSIPPIF